MIVTCALSRLIAAVLALILPQLGDSIPLDGSGGNGEHPGMVGGRRRSLQAASNFCVPRTAQQWLDVGVVVNDNTAMTVAGLGKLLTAPGWIGSPNIECPVNGGVFIVTPPLILGKCLRTVIPFSDRAALKYGCEGDVGTRCNYDCGSSTDDAGHGYVVCGPDRDQDDITKFKYTDTLGCDTTVGDSMAALATVTSLVVFSLVAAISVTSMATNLAVTSAMAATKDEMVDGDPLALLLPLQFVAMTGQIAAPTGPVYRDFTASFRWANMQFSPPSWLATREDDDWRQQGQLNAVDESLKWERRRRLSSDTSALQPMTSDQLAADYFATINETAADVFLGNIFAVATLILVATMLYGCTIGMFKNLNRKKTAKLQKVKAGPGILLPLDMQPPSPEPWTVPTQASFMRLLLTLLIGCYTGLTQSSMSAIMADETPSWVMIVAVLVFIGYSLGFAAFVILTVKQVMYSDASPTKLNEELRYMHYLPRLEDLRRAAYKQGGEADTEAALEVLSVLREELGKQFKQRGDNNDLRSNQGYWKASTLAARDKLLTFGMLFSSQTDHGIFMVGIELTRRLLLAVLLATMGGDKDFAFPQLLLMAILTVGQLGFIIHSQPFIEHSKNRIEGFVLMAQLALIGGALCLHIVQDDWEGWCQLTLIWSALAGVGIAVLQSLGWYLPIATSAISDARTGGTMFMRAVRARDVGALLTRITESNPVQGPVTMQYVSQVVDQKAQVQLKNATKKLTPILHAYGQASLLAAKEWGDGIKDLNHRNHATGIASVARDTGLLDHIRIPTSRFHCKGLLKSFQDVLKPECTQLTEPLAEGKKRRKKKKKKKKNNEEKRNKKLKKIVAEQAPKASDGVDDMELKFVLICEQFALAHANDAGCFERLEHKIDKLQSSGMITEILVAEGAAIPGTPQHAKLSTPPTAGEIKEAAVATCSAFVRQQIAKRTQEFFLEHEAALVVAVGLSNKSESQLRQENRLQMTGLNPEAVNNPLIGAQSREMEFGHPIGDIDVQQVSSSSSSSDDDESSSDSDEET